MRRIVPVLLLLACRSFAQVWTQLPDLPGTARDDASAFAIGADVYVGTGMEVGWGLTTDWYRFSTEEETWHAVASLPSTGRQYGTTFTIDAIGYLFGGLDANGRLYELWAYDPATDGWTQRASLPAAGRSGSVGFAIDGMGYVATGRYGPDDAVTSELWRYDPATDSWTQQADLPGVARLLASAFVLDGKGYVVGGQDWTGTAWNDAWAYDPVTDAWTPIANFPDARYGGEGFAVDGRGFVIAGLWSPSVIPTYTGLYDPATLAWTPGPSFIGNLRKGGAGAVVGHTVYYGTGISGDMRLKDWMKVDLPAGIAERQVIRLDLAPNPARDEIRLSGLDGHIVSGADLLDPQGRILRTYDSAALQAPLPLTALPAGAFMIVVRTTEGLVRRSFVHIP